MSNKTEFQLGGTRAWIVWVIAVLFVVWLFNVQTGYAIVNDSVSKALNLSIDQVGLIAATYTWTLPGKMLAGTQETLADYQSALLPTLIALAVALGIALVWIKESFPKQQ